MTLPCTVSTSSILPGWSLSFITILDGSISNTPTSEERISVSSSVIM